MYNYNNFINEYEKEENTIIKENSEYSNICNMYLNDQITLEDFNMKSSLLDDSLYLNVPNSVLESSINEDGILINEGIKEWGTKLKKDFSEGLDKVKKVSSKIIKTAWNALLSILKAGIKKVLGDKITDKVTKIVLNLLAKMGAFFDKFKKWLENSKFGKTYKMIIKIALGIGASVGAGYAATNLGPVWAPILAKKVASSGMKKLNKKVFDGYLYEGNIEVDIKEFPNFISQNPEGGSDEKTIDVKEVKDKLKNAFDKVKKFLMSMMKYLAKFTIGYFVLRLVLEIVKDLLDPILNFIPDLPWNITKAFGVMADSVVGGTTDDLISELSVPEPSMDGLEGEIEVDMKVENTVEVPLGDETVPSNIESDVQGGTLNIEDATDKEIIETTQAEAKTITEVNVEVTETTQEPTTQEPQTQEPQTQEPTTDNSEQAEKLAQRSSTNLSSLRQQMEYDLHKINPDANLDDYMEKEGYKLVKTEDGNYTYNKQDTEVASTTQSDTEPEEKKKWWKRKKG